MAGHHIASLLTVMLLAAPVAAGEARTTRPVAAGFSAADYARHVAQLKKKLPDDEFSIVIQPPFVVVGNESAQTLRRHAEGTIRWAVEHLKSDYFDKDPTQILSIWLFKDKETYEKYVPQVFGDRPSTPFGYYSARHRALIMNISTGGGTLVHEIVHPFVEANFPQCPSWLNEGLGSLYEQCGEKDGRIHGYTNWRLAGLQRAIRAGTLPAFRDLLTTSPDEFYNQDPGTNYAQARYLCFYLQEHGLLVDFYHRFHKNWSDDPTGYETLKAVLDESDMIAFERHWKNFVMKLTFE